MKDTEPVTSYGGEMLSRIHDQLRPSRDVLMFRESWIYGGKTDSEFGISSPFLITIGTSSLSISVHHFYIFRNTKKPKSVT
jgi:hypothetical protein